MTRKTVLISKAEYLSDYRIRLQFNDRKVVEVDFAPFLSSSRNPEIRKYIDKKLFKAFTLEHGELYWNDYDLIFPVMDLYANDLFRERTGGAREAS